MLSKLAYGVEFASGNDKVIRLVLLKNQPHALHIVAGIAPVATGIEIAEIQFVLKSGRDAGHGKRDFARHECFASPLALVVEENSVYGIHAVTLAIVLGYPVAIKFGASVRAARVERSGFALRHFLHLSEQLRRAGLINAGFFVEPEHSYRLKQAQSADGVGVGSVFRHFKRHFHMALCRKVVDFIRLQLLNDADQRT